MGNRRNLYGPAADAGRRRAMGMPEAQGVQGRTQAINNMSPANQEIANLKTKARAAGLPVPRRR